MARKNNDWLWWVLIGGGLGLVLWSRRKAGAAPVVVKPRPGETTQSAVDRTAAEIAKEDEILSKNADLASRTRFEFSARGQRHPIASQQFAHGGARTYSR